MIERLIVWNFQPHQKEVVELDPCVTVFAGPSGSGKSSLLRALRWACLNDPSGDEFISWNSSSVRVRVDADGRRIVRRKGEGGNLYHLDGEEFKSFGVGVPDPVADVLKVTENNFQRQLDAHFWIAAAPGQIAKDLNRIVDLSIIDSTLAAVATEVRRASSELDVSRRRTKEAEESFAGLDWVPSFVESVLKLERTEEKLEKKRLAASRIDSLVEDASRLIQERQDALEALSALPAAIETGAKAIELDKRIRKLSNLLNDYTLAKEEADRTPPSFDAIDGTVLQLADVRFRHDRLASLLRDVTKLEEASCVADQVARTSEEKLHEATKGRCPVCGKEIQSSPSPSAMSTSRTKRR